jgi:hypothetical protein
MPWCKRNSRPRDFLLERRAAESFHHLGGSIGHFELNVFKL